LLDEASKELLREFGRRNPEDVRARLWDHAPAARGGDGEGRT
jgi:hypothetical protein